MKQAERGSAPRVGRAFHSRGDLDAIRNGLLQRDDRRTGTGMGAANILGSRAFLRHRALMRLGARYRVFPLTDAQGNPTEDDSDYAKRIQAARLLRKRKPRTVVRVARPVLARIRGGKATKAERLAAIWQGLGHAPQAYK